jgi:C-terminal processing protease CtpA/Prc
MDFIIVAYSSDIISSRKKKNHFDGKVYVITGGNSFSATSLFAQVLKGQDNVLMVGEETGGGSYGNTSWYIPDVSLPITGIRFSLPRFRQVINKNNPKTGQGVQPDVYVNYTPYALRQGIDVKVEFVRRLILQQIPHTVKAN